MAAFFTWVGGFLLMVGACRIVRHVDPSQEWRDGWLLFIGTCWGFLWTSIGETLRKLEKEDADKKEKS